MPAKPASGQSTGKCTRIRVCRLWPACARAPLPCIAYAMDIASETWSAQVSDAKTRRRHHGQPVGLGGDAARRRDARGARRRLRRADRLRPPHARSARRLRQEREGGRVQGDRRRRGRRRAPARHDRGLHDAAGVRRPCPDQGARRRGQPALDRADAGGRAGRHARDRRAGRGQRRAARRERARPVRPRARGAPGSVARRRAPPLWPSGRRTPHPSRARHDPVSRRHDRHSRLRPARPDAGDRGAEARACAPTSTPPRPRRRPTTPRPAARPRRSTTRRRSKSFAARGRHRHLRVRERPDRDRRIPEPARPGAAGRRGRWR